MKFKIVFLDGHVVEQVADKFSIACVMAAYNRYCQGATRASELQIDEKKCSRIVPIDLQFFGRIKRQPSSVKIDPVEFQKSDSSRVIEYELTKRTLEFGQYLVRMDGHIQELDRITKEQVKKLGGVMATESLVDEVKYQKVFGTDDDYSITADAIAIKAARYDKMHDTVIKLARGVIDAHNTRGHITVCECPLCQLAKQVLNG